MKMKQELLTTNKRHCLKCRKPLIVRFNYLELLLCASGSISFITSMVKHPLQIFWVDFVENCEKIASSREPVVGILVLKVYIE